MLPPDQLVEKLLYVAREGAKWLIADRGVVLPYGITMDKAGDHPLTYYPADAHRGVSFNDLLDLVAEELTRRIAAGNVGAAAVVTTMENEDETALAFAVQVDSPAISLLMLYEYERTGGRVKVSEPRVVEGSLVAELF